MAPGVGTGPGRALKIRTFGVAGGTSQEALEEAEEGCDTISGTHNIDETDCHDSRLASLMSETDGAGGKHTIKCYFN